MKKLLPKCAKCGHAGEGHVDQICLSGFESKAGWIWCKCDLYTPQGGTQVTAGREHEK